MKPLSLGIQMNSKESFRKILLDWYGLNARELPWRNTRDPYNIWISEVILQQTRIAQGSGYYQRFLVRFPDVATLAAASEEEVLKIWQGLGYYSRARNLHGAAREIVSKHEGIFPDNYDDLIRLKGIGEYTAAAILSIAFDQPFPVVDGNVIRFISRHFGIHDRVDHSRGKKRIKEMMQELIGNSKPGMFNQAAMEFGALQCIPANPVCGRCPLKGSCVASNQRKVNLLPVKPKVKKQAERYFNYFVITWMDRADNVYLYLNKREGDDVWKNLYDFPLIETKEETRHEELLMSAEWNKIMGSEIRYKITGEVQYFRHILTHQIIHARFCTLQIESDKRPQLSFLLVGADDIGRYPVSRLIEEFFLKNPVLFQVK